MIFWYTDLIVNLTNIPTVFKNLSKKFVKFVWKVIGNIFNVNNFKDNSLLGFLLMNLLKPFLTVRSEPNALVSEIQQQQSTKQIGQVVRTL